ncbi:hypothetical protein ACFX1X_035317 [Malus domestica]
MSELAVFFFSSSCIPNHPAELGQSCRAPGAEVQPSGYIPINEDSRRAFSYWFVEAVEDPHSKLVIFWLNGGGQFYQLSSLPHPQRP